MEPEIYQRRERTEILQVTVQTELQSPDLYKWLEGTGGGKNRNAVLLDLRNCGGHRTENSVKQQPGLPEKGRKQWKDPEQEAITRTFADAIDYHYIGIKTASLSSTYNRMIGLK